jgi:signal transduction histidine kinase
MATVSWDTPDGAKEHALGAETRIGRSPRCEIGLLHPGVSAFHARIVRDGSRWVLEDTGSKNGTFVNDEQRDRFELADGDVIAIGFATLTFHATEPKESLTMLWKKGTALAPSEEMTTAILPVSAPQRPATSLGEILREDVDYSHIRTVDQDRFTTVVLPGISEDPIQLARRLKASYEIARATAATLDQSEILDRVLAVLIDLFERADRGFIVLVEPKTGEVSTAAARYRAAGNPAEAAISRTALDYAMRTREAMLCTDAATDARLARAQSVVGLGIRSMMIAPLVFRDEVLGAVHIDTIRGVHEFSDTDLELLAVAASQMAGCLANARLHEQVVASERLAAVGQTLAGLTHCIKNILQGIKGGAYILDLGLQQDNPDRVRAGWDMVRRNNAVMEDLVFDLLTYSKGREPEYGLTDLNTLCAETCELVAARAKSLSVSLAFSPDPSLGQVEADPKGIRRCLLNLIGNAVDACAEKKAAVAVTTRAPAEDGLVRILVRDAGCGMSPETLRKLFTVFFSTKGSKGTGLGLPVTQKIVQEHGGRIDVESQEGQGTTFTVCLPPHRP